MRVIADLHIHSRFARACSKALTVKTLSATAVIKGITVLGTGDFLHPAWFAELRRDLLEAEDGLYQISSQQSAVSSQRLDVRSPTSTRFMLTAEVSCIYSKGGKVRRVHNLIFVPSWSCAERLRDALLKRGAKLSSDGRPIIGLDSKELLKMVLALDEDAMLVPAHAWTPWFAVFGSKSGFDSLEECFGELTGNIAAIETGLSSDPPMNWRVSALDSVSLISNSDAHSLPNLGREANILEVEALSYGNIIRAIRNSSPAKLSVVSHQLSAGRNNGLKDRIISTIEFYPEEGMYHYDGHRACNTHFEPSETKKHRGVCPRCRLPLTIGVLNRVDTLADRPEGFRPEGSPDFLSLVELDKIIAESLGVRSRASKRVAQEYEKILASCGSELHVLMDMPLDALAQVTTATIVEGIRRVRARELEILPGFDGQYGTVRIFPKGLRKTIANDGKQQLTFLSSQ